MSQLLLTVHDCPKCGVSLQAADQLAQDDLNALPRGPKLLCDVRKPRSVQHHRLFFAMVRKIAQATPTPLNEEALRDYITVKAGHVNTIPLAFGKVYRAPASIAFDKMDQIQFRAFFDRAVEIILTDICPALPDGFADEFLAMLETPSTPATMDRSAPNKAGRLVGA